ncbi:unnamed protein product [Chrysoparadoxa australica]
MIPAVVEVSDVKNELEVLEKQLFKLSLVTPIWQTCSSGNADTNAISNSAVAQKMGFFANLGQAGGSSGVREEGIQKANLMSLRLYSYDLISKLDGGNGSASHLRDYETAVEEMHIDRIQTWLEEGIRSGETQAWEQTKAVRSAVSGLKDFEDSTKEKLCYLEGLISEHRPQNLEVLRQERSAVEKGRMPGQKSRRGFELGEAFEEERNLFHLQMQMAVLQSAVSEKHDLAEGMRSGQNLGASELEAVLEKTAREKVDQLVRLSQKQQTKLAQVQLELNEQRATMGDLRRKIVEKLSETMKDIEERQRDKEAAAKEETDPNSGGQSPEESPDTDLDTRPSADEAMQVFFRIDQVTAHSEELKVKLAQLVEAKHESERELNERESQVENTLASAEAQCHALRAQFATLRRGYMERSRDLERLQRNHGRKQAKQKKLRRAGKSEERAKRLSTSVSQECGLTQQLKQVGAALSYERLCLLVSIAEAAIATEAPKLGAGGEAPGPQDDKPLESAHTAEPQEHPQSEEEGSQRPDANEATGPSVVAKAQALFQAESLEEELHLVTQMENDTAADLERTEEEIKRLGELIEDTEALPEAMAQGVTLEQGVKQLRDMLEREDPKEINSGSEDESDEEEDTGASTNLSNNLKSAVRAAKGRQLGAKRKLEATKQKKKLLGKLIEKATSDAGMTGSKKLVPEEKALLLRVVKLGKKLSVACQGVAEKMQSREVRLGMAGQLVDLIKSSGVALAAVECQAEEEEYKKLLAAEKGARGEAGGHREGETAGNAKPSKKEALLEELDMALDRVQHIEQELLEARRELVEKQREHGYHHERLAELMEERELLLSQLKEEKTKRQEMDPRIPLQLRRDLAAQRKLLLALGKSIALSKARLVRALRVIKERKSQKETPTMKGSKPAAISKADASLRARVRALNRQLAWWGKREEEMKGEGKEQEGEAKGTSSQRDRGDVSATNELDAWVNRGDQSQDAEADFARTDAELRRFTQAAAKQLPGESTSSLLPDAQQAEGHTGDVGKLNDAEFDSTVRRALRAIAIRRARDPTGMGVVYTQTPAKGQGLVGGSNTNLLRDPTFREGQAAAVAEAGVQGAVAEGEVASKLVGGVLSTTPLPPMQRSMSLLQHSTGGRKGQSDFLLKMSSQRSLKIPQRPPQMPK